MRELLLPAFLLLVGCAFCSCTDSENAFYEHRIDALTFTIHTPAGWTLFEDQGIDTYIGRIAGQEDTIYFDQGFLSFRSLDDITEDDRTIYIKETEIGGVPAIIHKVMLGPDSQKRIRLSVFIEADDIKKNHLFVFDPSGLTNEITIINVFRSHKFK